MQALSYMPTLAPGSNGFKSASFAPLRKGRDRRSMQSGSNQKDLTVIPDDELDSLNSRIFRREITAVILHISNMVLLHKD